MVIKNHETKKPTRHQLLPFINTCQKFAITWDLVPCNSKAKHFICIKLIIFIPWSKNTFKNI